MVRFIFEMKRINFVIKCFDLQQVERTQRIDQTVQTTLMSKRKYTIWMKQFLKQVRIKLLHIKNVALQTLDVFN